MSMPIADAITPRTAKMRYPGREREDNAWPGRCYWPAYGTNGHASCMHEYEWASHFPIVFCGMQWHAITMQMRRVCGQ